MNNRTRKTLEGKLAELWTAMTLYEQRLETASKIEERLVLLKNIRILKGSIDQIEELMAR